MRSRFGSLIFIRLLLRQGNQAASSAQTDESTTTTKGQKFLPTRRVLTGSNRPSKSRKILPKPAVVTIQNNRKLVY